MNAHIAIFTTIAGNWMVAITLHGNTVDLPITEAAAKRLMAVGVPLA